MEEGLYKQQKTGRPQHFSQKVIVPFHKMPPVYFLIQTLQQ